MDADDRALISGLFDRMKHVGALEKDRDADTLINDSMRRNPDSPYLLVQSVLVQEQALQQADARIRELESRVADLEAGDAAGPATADAQAAARGPLTAPRKSAGFASGRSAQATSVPISQPPERHRPAAAGGFMAQAMTTAAGVAGGMLLASGIQSLFSGSSQASEATADTAQTGDGVAAATETAAADQQASEAAQTPDPQSDNDALHDAAAEGDGWEDWGDDDWGGGFDI